jgi:hypothetical protein
LGGPRCDRWRDWWSDWRRSGHWLRRWCGNGRGDWWNSLTPSKERGPATTVRSPSGGCQRSGCIQSTVWDVPTRTSLYRQLTATGLAKHAMRAISRTRISFGRPRAGPLVAGIATTENTALEDYFKDLKTKDTVGRWLRPDDIQAGHHSTKGEATCILCRARGKSLYLQPAGHFGNLGRSVNLTLLEQPPLWLR